jgi:hypothetical protein
VKHASRRRARWGIATLGAALPLVAAELLLRLFLPGSVDVMNNARFTRVSLQPGQMTELIPGSENPDFVGGPVRVNALGFRGAEIDVPKPAGRYRLLAVGDSVTFGFGVPEAETFHARLAASRVGAGQPVEVVNAGLPGAGLPEYFHTVRRWCGPIDADAVLVSVVLNDIVAYRPEESEDAPIPGSRAAADPASWSRFLRHSYLATHGFQRLKSILYAVKFLNLEDSPGYRFVPLENDAAAAEAA